MPKPENLIGKGFDKNPQNINKNGRPPSLKQRLQKLLDGDGKMKFKKKDIITIHDNGDVTIKVPMYDALMIKLVSMAMSDNLPAIKLIMEYLEGKPEQKVTTTDETPTSIVINFPENYKLPNNENDVQ